MVNVEVGNLIPKMVIVVVYFETLLADGENKALKARTLGEICHQIVTFSCHKRIYFPKTIDLQGIIWPL